MRYKKSKIESQNNGTGWLTTFNDMITLLMVFFVLLFTMGSLDVKRVKHFQNALQSAIGVLKQGSHVNIGIMQELEWNDEDIKRARELAQQEVQKKQAQYYELLKEQFGNMAKLTRNNIRLTLEDELLFPAAGATLTPSGKMFLDKVIKMLKRTNMYVRIEGHTDNLPISTVNFPSNWELSTTRAVNVVKYMIKKGIDPARLSAAGYGAVKPVAQNSTASGRARNRRVEIVLSPTL